MKSLLIQHVWLNAAFSIFLLLTSLVLIGLFFLVLFIPSYRKNLTIYKDKGEITISKRTIESVIRNAYATVIPPDRTKLRVKIHKDEKIDVKIILFAGNKERYRKMAEEIQHNIEIALDLSIQAKVRHVQVAVKEKEMDQNKKNSASHSKSSRVV